MVAKAKLFLSHKAKPPTNIILNYFVTYSVCFAALFVMLCSYKLQHTELCLSIEKKRFEEKLNVIYHIETREFCVPALTMQPLVKNAVKHGVLKRKKGGIVTISTRENTDDYEITIANVRDRLWSMCLRTLTIESEIGRGTRATIRIPKGDIKR